MLLGEKFADGLPEENNVGNAALPIHDPVLSKNTNELKTGAPGRFGSETSEAWLANGS